MENETPPCRICKELENAVHSAQQTDAPDILVGLTAAGNRNRVEQRREKLLKTQADLAKHRKAIHGL